MIGGDLDDAPLPAEVYVLWEHLIALPGPRYDGDRLQRLVRRGRLAAALDLFPYTNTPAVQNLWWLWEMDQPVALLTYLPYELAHHLAERVHLDDVPHSRIEIGTPQSMARRIAFDGARWLFHAIPEHALLYGPKGFFVPPDRPHLMQEALP